MVIFLEEDSIDAFFTTCSAEELAAAPVLTEQEINNMLQRSIDMYHAMRNRYGQRTIGQHWYW